jgi:hypothetical protein
MPHWRDVERERGRERERERGSALRRTPIIDIDS